MNWTTIKTKLKADSEAIIVHKKWAIMGALLALIWLPIAACSQKEAPKPTPVQKVEQPYTVTKTDPKLAPAKAAKPAPKKKQVHKPSPAKREACTILFLTVDC